MSGRRILLLGHPVEHSLSPAFQQAAFDSIGLPVRYEAMDVAPADLARVVAELRADPLVMGANVTVPHKEKIAPLLDSLTDDAVQIGAVNTITRAGSRLVGRNTDAAGFRGALDGLLDGEGGHLSTRHRWCCATLHCQSPPGSRRAARCRSA
jgi:shikimate dehydrogenase